VTPFCCQTRQKGSFIRAFGFFEKLKTLEQGINSKVSFRMTLSDAFFCPNILGKMVNVSVIYLQRKNRKKKESFFYIKKVAVEIFLWIAEGLCRLEFLMLFISSLSKPNFQLKIQQRNEEIDTSNVFEIINNK